MTIKVLLGEIGVVAILILVSFTNVVSVQSTTFGSINQSPLFSIRTQKAINKESKTVLTSDYLGKGFCALLFPPRDSRTAPIQKVVEIIENMDEKAISTFIAMIIARMNIGNQRKDISNLEIFNAINWLKMNRGILINYIDVIKNNIEPKVFSFAGPGCQWRLGGWLIEIILFIFFFLYANIIVYFTLAYCYTSQCSP